MVITTVSHGVRATITYTMLPTPFKGEGSPGPIIGSGLLRVASRGGSFAVPLRSLDIDKRHWSIFPTTPGQGCGAGAPLTIYPAQDGRDYVVVESIQVGKGCRAAAHLVDVTTHHLLREYAVDHASVHADDVPPSTFAATKRVTVTCINRFAIPFGAPSVGWNLTVIQGTGTEFFVEDLPASETPRIGETLTLGILRDQTFTAHLFVGGRIFRLSAKHELAWAARQTPVPKSMRRARLYNMYFMYSDRLARAGRFARALWAYRRALQYLDDTNLRKGEAAEIPRLAAIVRAVRDNRMTVAKAKDAWFKP